VEVMLAHNDDLKSTKNKGFSKSATLGKEDLNIYVHVNIVDSIRYRNTNALSCYLTSLIFLFS